MKFLHLADLHLGKTLGDFELISDQRYILEEIIEIAKKNMIDAVLIAGDVYDRSIPSEAAVNLLDYFINRLVKEKISIFIISGNHDSDERLNFGATMFQAKGVYIEAKFDGRLHKYELKNEKEKVNIYMMPFIKASQVRHFYPEEKINSYDDAIKVVIRNSAINPKEMNILLAHQFVGGRSIKPQLAGSERVAIQNVGLVEMVGYDCFEVFNYVALGHIHSPQKVGREEIRYSGSPLKYSLSEVNNEKSIPIITVEKNREIEIEFVKLKPKRDLRHIKGKMKQLLDNENIKSPEDFIYITLTDEEIINDAISIFQQVYPNVVKIDYDNSHTKEICQTDIFQAIEDKNFTDMISDFYTLIYGCEISTEELSVMREIAREAGVEDETE